jgi:hypothetical protein
MSLTFDQLRTPKPTETLVVWDGQDLHVTYDRNAFTIDVIESVYRMPIRQRLVQVLIGWDLLRDGQPWQPEPRDHPGWDAIVLARREMTALVAAGEDTPLEETERATLYAPPITTAERDEAYQDAWGAILVQLPREFVKAVDTGVLDDFLGVSWRVVTSVNGSAPPANTGVDRGGTTTPTK